MGFSQLLLDLVLEVLIVEPLLLYIYQKHSMTADILALGSSQGKPFRLC